MSFQHKRHSIEKLECWVSTKSFHAFNCSKLHGMKLPLPAVVMDLGLDEGVRVCHVEGGGDLLFNSQGGYESQVIYPVTRTVVYFYTFSRMPKTALLTNYTFYSISHDHHHYLVPIH